MGKIDETSFHSILIDIVHNRTKMPLVAEEAVPVVDLPECF